MRHRAKLVGLRSNLKCQVHGVLAGAGVAVPMSDLFSLSGQQLLARTQLAALIVKNSLAPVAVAGLLICLLISTGLNRAWAESHGCAGFVPKPIDVGVLLAELKRSLETRASEKPRPS